MNEDIYLNDDTYQVVAVREYRGRITDFKLTNGKVVNFEEMRSLIDRGKVYDLIYTFGRNDTPIIRSKPDSSRQNNLDNLPRF